MNSTAGSMFWSPPTILSLRSHCRIRSKADVASVSHRSVHAFPAAASGRAIPAGTASAARAGTTRTSRRPRAGGCLGGKETRLDDCGPSGVVWSGELPSPGRLARDGGDGEDRARVRNVCEYDSNRHEAADERGVPRDQYKDARLF